MLHTHFYKLFLIGFLCTCQAIGAMDDQGVKPGKQEAPDEVAPAPRVVPNIINPGKQEASDDKDAAVYDSDSEDEDGYKYKGFPDLDIPKGCDGECIALARGIHFSPTKFAKEDRSQMRKSNDAGVPAFSSAAYDLACIPLGSTENTGAVLAKAREIRAMITRMTKDARARFQQLYSNQYDGFHRRLGTNEENGVFQPFQSKFNPQVSTAENFFHAEKYASGMKYLGADVELLDPEYDDQGQPKHPYLGKLFVMLVQKDKLKELDPYFVVQGHAADDITISTHFSKNILAEREVSFPGFVPGECTVLSVPIRVPSFAGEYKPWYQEKFGVSKRVYNSRKKMITTGAFFKDEKRSPEVVKANAVKTLLMKHVLPHVETQLKDHVQAECESRGIRLVYKQLDGTFGPTLPSLQNATDYRKRIKKGQQ